MHKTAMACRSGVLNLEGAVAQSERTMEASPLRFTCLEKCPKNEMVDEDDDEDDD